MKDLRIVFMGTPDFAVAILEKMVVSGCNIVGVITAPDKPAGRGRKLNESAVKKYANSQNLLVLQPTNLKDESFLSNLSELKADIQVVVAFRMLPKVVWNMPKQGTFNLHASLLPDYRGAAPIHWAIINGEKTTGVTTFFIDEKIDTGEIILHKTCEIREDETVGKLHDKLMYLGADLVLETLELISQNKAKTIKQTNDSKKEAPKLNNDNTRINWNAPLDNIYNQIRGLNPFPAAWTKIKNGEDIISAKIYAVEKLKENHHFKTGKILASKKELKIAVQNGFIVVKELKLSGKKKMDIISLLNGFSFEQDARMLSSQ